MDIGNCINDFCTSLLARGRSNSTIGVYRERLATLPKGDVVSITPQILDSLIAGQRNRNLSPATIAGFVQAYKTFFLWLVRRQLVTVNPTTELVKPNLRGRRKPKAINQQDLTALISAANARGLALEYAVLMMLADTGARAGELASLNIDDLDLTGLEATCCGKTGEGQLYFTEPTGQALRAWLLVRPATDPEALFTTRRGRISYDRVYACIRDLANDLGIKRFNPHSIRHRVGQGWIDAGANLEIVRQKLRHKDITTTAMVYGNQDEKRIKTASQQYSLVK